MRIRLSNVFKPCKALWSALAQFAPQVLPFVKQLAVRLLQRDFYATAGYFAAVKVIAASARFFIYGFQITRHCRDWLCVRPEPDELGMVPVALGFASKDLLGQ